MGMVVKASFSLWSPELYVGVGDVHVYVSLWKTLLLVGIVFLLRRTKAVDSPDAQRSNRALLGFVTLLYVLSVAWLPGLKGLALPWDNPPSHIQVDGIDYGAGQGTPDPRVATYGCNSEEEIRNGTFAADPQDITELEEIGHLGGVLGGPAIYFAHGDSGGWLLVRPTADCWIPYPEWI